MSLNRRLRNVLGAALLATTPACIGGTDSLIVQDQRVETGRREFDSYFSEVDDLRDEVEQLDSEMYDIRANLIEALGVSPEISLGALLEKTRKRVDKAKGYGTALTLTLSPRPRIIVVAGETGDERDDQFGVAVEQSAEKALDKFKAYTKLLEQVSALDKRRGELADKIDRLPAEYQGKKDLFETEIVGAGDVLQGAESKLLRDTRTLSHFLVGLTTAVNSGGLESRSEKCDEAIAFMEKEKEKEKTKAKWKSRWRGRPRGKPAPRPRPAPTGGDFEM
jgi:hypothetical protein